MFTDIKNCQNMNRNNCNETCDHKQWSTSNKRRRKAIRKLWQPLKRLVTLKANTINNQQHNNDGVHNNNTNNSIPNNVNLNNNKAITSSLIRRRLEVVAETEQETVTNESLRLDISQAVIEANQRHQRDHTISHNLALIEFNNKLPIDDRLMQHNNEEDGINKSLHVKLIPNETQPLIQSASIEKETMILCTNCIYGKNCLHMNNIAKYGMDSYLLPQLSSSTSSTSSSSSSSSSSPSSSSSLPAIDREVEHLREWLKQNSWHMLKNMS